jgi:predicted nucleic acid-binding protein
VRRRQVFVDTWAWIAWANKRDPAHARAVALRQAVQREGAGLVTSDLVLCEALTRLRYDFGLPTALLLLATLEFLVDDGAVEVVFVDQRLWKAALAWFQSFTDQRFSFVDCSSFAIMAERELDTALTADRHFTTAGFIALGAIES